MITYIDDFLNKITMYRLLLYFLICLLAIAVIFGFFKILPFSPLAIIVSSLFLVAVCWATNTMFAKIFNAPTNLESVYITSLILALIITPTLSLQSFPFLFWAGVLAITSKYVVAIHKKHIFNPAAFAVVLTAFAIGHSASWWVGTLAMMPFVFLGGLLIVRKIQRFDLVFYFLLTSLAVTLGFSIFNKSDILSVLKEAVFYSPLFFFAFVMLTEPLTTPPTKKLQSYYGALVGLLFAPQIHLGSLYTTPELALVIGNIFSYIVSPKAKLVLMLKEKVQLAPDIYDFIFQSNRKLSFLPGQYLEWTIGHTHPDSRGNRRYFTIASSPTEQDIILGVKFHEPSSSFKKGLNEMPSGSILVAGQLSGDFTLPEDQNKKLVFVAGGIGITPFRSMIKYLIDTKQKRSIVLFFANKDSQEIVYRDVFDKAEKELGFKIIYAVSNLDDMSSDKNIKAGRISEEMIRQEVPDFQERIFYLSGPRSLVTGFEDVLKKMGIKRASIKTDFFPGYA